MPNITHMTRDRDTAVHIVGLPHYLYMVYYDDMTVFSYLMTGEGANKLATTMITTNSNHSQSINNEPINYKPST
jgi:hypothetical protein